MRGGLCEDSLNLIRATGTIRELIIRDSDQDAIDVDLSTIESGSVTVTNAGNDCFAVSTGTNRIETLVGRSCTAKVVSIGEQSDVSVERAVIDGANYGFVAKDSSSLRVEHAENREVNACASAHR